MEKTVKLGNKVIVTDPCYEFGTWCTAVVKNLLEGNWIPEIVSERGRIKSLTLRHSGYKKFVFEYAAECGVDSGQLGIFDIDYYKENQPDDRWEDTESWYRRTSELTINKPNWGITDEKGVVSESGYGDGCYALYTAENKDGKVVAMRVVFID